MATGIIDGMELDPMREMAEAIARRLIPEGADRETLRVEAYLKGNCTECFTSGALKSLPSDVSLCEACAHDEGWNVCSYCEKWVLDWHRWLPFSHECTECLRTSVYDVGFVSADESWTPEECDCRRCREESRHPL